MSRIVSARVIITCLGRNFVTPKIEAEDDLTGVGDTANRSKDRTLHN